jgi:predicted transposase YdaD
LLREIRPFAAVVLFIDASLDPGNPPLNPAPPNQLIRCNLVDCLKSIQDNATPLVVLKPLTLEDKADLPEAVGQWKAGIDAMALPEDRKKTLTELLEYAILQRFKEFTLEEIQKMIQLTPLEETVAGKQLIDMGMEKGMEKGHLIGQIQSIQRFLKRPRTPNETLARLDVEELGTVLANLDAELGRLEL